MSEGRLDHPTADEAAEGWKRIVASLRAYRDREKQAWNGVDENLLARYFSGSLTAADGELLERAKAASPKVQLALQALDAMRAVAPQVAPRRAVAATPLRWRSMMAWGALAACLLVGAGVSLMLAFWNQSLSQQLAEARKVGKEQERVLASARQLYSPWVYDPSAHYWYRFFLFRASPQDANYTYHYVVYPARQATAYVYYYNPVSGKYWGRFDLAQPEGETGYSLLPQPERQPELSAIPESAFPAPGPMPPIPGARDGTTMEPPPRDLPTRGKLPDLPRLGDRR